MSSDRISCVACKHEIDAAARLCPYCGADPRTGEKFDTEALLQSEFRARKPLTASENVLEYARQRQGFVVTFAIAAVVLVLVGLHQFATRRNERHVSTAAAVPLTEVTDIGGQDDNQPPPPMPELQFQHEGNPQTMRTFVVEAGAVTPPNVVAAQQAAAAAKGQRQSKQQDPATQPPPAIRPPVRH